MWTTTLKQQLGPTLAHERVEETISQEDEAFVHLCQVCSFQEEDYSILGIYVSSLRHATTANYKSQYN